MIAVDDTRKLLQDLVAPDLKSIQTEIHALSERVNSLEKTMEQRFSASDKSMDQRFTAAEEIAKIRHELILANLSAVMQNLNTDARLMRIEAQLNQPPGGITSRT
jgi:cell division septum initiation protein DivIVA